MEKNKLVPHWDYPNGPRDLMKRVYYQKDVGKLLERSLIFDSWGDAWEVQRAIFDRIKVYCQWAKCDKFFDDIGRYKKQVEEIKRLVSFWRRLKQIRRAIAEVKNV